MTGSILFGGIDSEKFHDSLTILPVQKSSDDSYRDFTVALSSVSVIDATGKTAFFQDNLDLPVILDSGTTITYLPDQIVDPIISGVGAVNDPDFGLILPCAYRSSAANFSFGFGGNGGLKITVDLGEFITDLYTSDSSVPTFEDGAGPVCSFGLESSGTGPILFGDTFLRSAYVVYDMTNNQIGMGQTKFNATGSNIVEISGSAIPSATATATGVAVTQNYSGHPQVTDAATKTGGAQATSGHGSPTFNLGVNPTGGGKKGAATALGAPKVGAVTVVTGMVCLLSLIFGSSMVFMI